GQASEWDNPLFSNLSASLDEAYSDRTCTGRHQLHATIFFEHKRYFQKIIMQIFMFYNKSIFL
ncbi:hypothetical protein ACJX0J_027303, partial [Zea mays]